MCGTFESPGESPEGLLVLGGTGDGTMMALVLLVGSQAQGHLMKNATLFVLFCFVLGLFRATPTAYGGSQAGG